MLLFLDLSENITRKADYSGYNKKSKK